MIKPILASSEIGVSYNPYKPDPLFGPDCICPAYHSPDLRLERREKRLESSVCRLMLLLKLASSGPGTKGPKCLQDTLKRIVIQVTCLYHLYGNCWEPFKLLKHFFILFGIFRDEWENWCKCVTSFALSRSFIWTWEPLQQNWGAQVINQWIITSNNLIRIFIFITITLKYVV